jgi:hypothetical protein
MLILFQTPHMSYMRMNRFKKKGIGKQPTSEKPPYLIYNPHTLPAPVAVDESESPSDELDTWIQIGSIDPGPKHTGMRIEKRWVKSSDIDMAYNTPDPTAVSYHVNSIVLMDNFLEMLCDCHYIVIESQMTFNTEATRFGQHIITYLLIKCKDKGNRPLIVELDSHHKTRLLGAPKLNIAKKEHKKWCLAKARSLFVERGDVASIQFLDFITKKDDCGDAACQIEVWWMILRGLYVPPQPKIVVKKPTKAQILATSLATAKQLEQDRLIACMPRPPIVHISPRPISRTVVPTQLIIDRETELIIDVEPQLIID